MCKFASGEYNIANYTPHIEIDKNTPTFTLFAKNTAAVFLLVVKMTAPLRVNIRESATLKVNFVGVSVRYCWLCI